jgi:hypothetical protein
LGANDRGRRRRHRLAARTQHYEQTRTQPPRHPCPSVAKSCDGSSPPISSVVPCVKGESQSRHRGRHGCRVETASPAARTFALFLAIIMGQAWIPLTISENGRRIMSFRWAALVGRGMCWGGWVVIAEPSWRRIDPLPEGSAWSGRLTRQGIRPDADLPPEMRAVLTVTHREANRSRQSRRRQQPISQ